MATWRCKECGETIEGCTAPELCPNCGAAREDLEAEETGEETEEE